MELILLLAIDEEEGFVLANWTANGTAKLVQIELFRRGGEEALGIERSVAQKLEQRSVKVVGPGFCGDQHGRSGAGPVLGGVVVSQNLEFLNVIDRGKSSDAAGSQFVVVHTIQDPVGAVGTRAANGEREGAARGDLAAGSRSEKAIGVRLRRCSGSESGELNEIAAIQRELGDLLRVDDLAEGRIGGFYRYGGSG